MATMLAYGFFGDIIHQSDKWRFLGPLRYDVAGFCQFIRNKSYHSNLTITLSSHMPSTTTDADGTTESSDPARSQEIPSDTHLTTLDNDPPKKSFRSTCASVLPALIFCSRNCETCAVDSQSDRPPPLSIEREGNYTTINCLNMPCRCAKSKFGMSPFVHLGKASPVGTR